MIIRPLEWVNSPKPCQSKLQSITSPRCASASDPNCRNANVTDFINANYDVRQEKKARWNSYRCADAAKEWIRKYRAEESVAAARSLFGNNFDQRLREGKS